MRAMLQVNARGTWAHVVEFDAQAVRQIALAAENLWRALDLAHDAGDGGGATFRIVKVGPGRSPKVLAHIGRRK